MKKNGFTLIELLAVIIILGVISLIAIPIVLGVREKADRGAFKDSAYGLLSAAQAYTSSMDITGIKVFECDGVSCSIKTKDKDGNLIKEELSIKGETPLSGSIIIESGASARLVAITNKKYCATGTATTLEIGEKENDSCGSIDRTSPTINSARYSVETTTSTGLLTLYDDFAVTEGSKIVKYRYELYLDGKKLQESESAENSILYKGLESDTTYDVKVTVTNENGVSSEEEISFKTDDMKTPKITSNAPVKAGTNIFEAQIITIDFSKIKTNEEPGNYIKTSRKGKSDIKVKEKCGTGIRPTKCEAIEETTEIEANTWYKTGEKIIVTYDEETDITTDYITAIAYDGTNFSGSRTYMLGRVVKEPPHVTYSLESGKYRIREAASGNKSSYSVTVDIESLYLDEVEIRVYKNGSELTNKRIKNSSLTNTVVLEEYGVYEIRTKAIDMAGRIQNSEPQRDGWYYKTYEIEENTAHQKCGIASCRIAECGVESYNTCENSACGVKSYKLCQHQKCGYNTCWHS